MNITVWQSKTAWYSHGCPPTSLLLSFSICLDVLCKISCRKNKLSGHCSVFSVYSTIFRIFVGWQTYGCVWLCAAEIRLWCLYSTWKSLRKMTLWSPGCPPMPVLLFSQREHIVLHFRNIAITHALRTHCTWIYGCWLWPIWINSSWKVSVCILIMICNQARACLWSQRCCVAVTIKGPVWV